MDLRDFHSSWQREEPFVVHHGTADLKELRDLPFVASLEALLGLWESSVQVHLPDLRDEASAIEVPTSEAKAFFDQGMGLLFNDVNRVSPLLQSWVDQIRSDLGISALTQGRSLIYVTPDGQGTAAHFDQNINFVLQISGTKKWTLSPNKSVKNPMDRFTMGLPVDPEMMSYQEQDMPSEMPQERLSFELKPGSLLFVPRGVWHSTEAEGHALSLNFTFTAPTWTDLFLSALRSRLVESPHWRESALVRDEKKFDELLEMLKYDLPNWRAQDILQATENSSPD